MVLDDDALPLNIGSKMEGNSKKISGQDVPQELVKINLADRKSEKKEKSESELELFVLHSSTHQSTRGDNPAGSQHRMLEDE